MDSGDTAWLLTSSALVLLMTPGLAFFYGGMVRSKNVLSMLMKNYISMGIVTIAWVLVVASLAFGGNTLIGDYSFIGDFSLWGLRDVGIGNDIFGATYPDALFLMFQLTFAIITPALISGAIAERMKFSAWVVFIAIWVVVVYAPMAHWVWGGGFIAEWIGAIDFAGGLVVHINAGAAALAVIMVLGPRLGFRREIIRPHSLPLTILGGGLLWFGWFGFNGGSALAADGAAANAVLTTQVAAATAATFWVLAESLSGGKPTTLGFISGAVAGLVAITPAAGFVDPLGALIIGAVAGPVCFWALRLKFRFNFDDSLDVVAVHLVGGIIGSVLLGVLAVESYGGVAGSMDLLGRQILSVVVVLTYSFGVTWVIAKVIDVAIGLRVTEEIERNGLDLGLHEEQSYVMVE
ncbi:MAG: ammonium transporter [Chloroflexi bacterium]|nr:ammonium transporter [Chloroflexota bacterium]MQC16730.1 ammonium transporter [Chloroflexota bacterium]